ncbi:aminotransferase class III-fold pyridoxal phosphate-dependent enzyme [Lacrimispora sp.]|uniref:aminotransferase class III-fold pyridoxal phosphate-dependent enzyme n=1 Tax=Lacrimispora sp. TaxID=2719234 RepID=UPI00346127E3
MDKEIRLNKSIQFEKKCSKIIPAGSSTLAKSPHRLSPGHSPFYAESAYGSHFTDIDGNAWLDCEMAMGTVVWGHNRKEVNDAIIKQVYKGINFSVPSTLEYELAEIILARFQQYKAIKFFKNGADSVYAAVRSARYQTGRNMTLSFGEYHGWLDWCSPSYYNCLPSSLGIPDKINLTHISCQTDKEEFTTNINNYGEKIACVILCPANYSSELLKDIIELCHAKGIYVIFDEVTSGIRFAYGGATTLFNLRPDFLCISKGLTNGLPLALVLGDDDDILIMEQLQISNAHAGEHLALAAAIACEKLLSETNEWPTWNQPVKKIMDELSMILTSERNTSAIYLSGSTGCFSLHTPGFRHMEDPFRYHLMEYMSKQLIFTKGYIIFSDSHTIDEIKKVGAVLCDCVKDYYQKLQVNS